MKVELVLGAADDRSEREADRVARQVAGGVPLPVGGVRRPCGVEDAASADGGVLGAGVAGEIEEARSGGRPLPADVRRSMEAALGADLAGVRLHTDPRADRLARSLGATAFTTGEDVFFRQGAYDPSGAGLELLAHELTHVVQQAGGSSRGRFPVGRAVLPGGTGAQRPVQRLFGFEFETTVQVRGAFYGNYWDGGQSLGAFADEEQVYRSGRWKVVTDEGRLEFVTDALPNLATVQQVAGEIEAFIGGLQAPGPPKPERKLDIRTGRAGTWAPRPDRPDYTVHLGAGYKFEKEFTPQDWYGQPQISFGVRTDRVDRALRWAQVDQPLAGLKAEFAGPNGAALAPPLPTKGAGEVESLDGLLEKWDARFVATRSFKGVEAAVQPIVDTRAAQLPPAERSKVAGLWTLMAYYWRNLRRAADGSYRKSQLVMMARTDFHSFHNNLSAAAKQVFRAAEPDFLAAEGALVSGGAGGTIAGTKITLARWYQSVRQPEAGCTYDGRAVDLLSAKQSLTNEVISTGTDKSMGQYPLDPPAASPLAVFELRRVTPGLRVPIGLLYSHVLQPLYAWVETQNR